MDSEAAVIRSEMTRTRAELDRKLSMLAARAQDYTPRAMAQRHLPEFLAERVIGSALTLTGLLMAWGQYRRRRSAAPRPLAGRRAWNPGSGIPHETS